MLSVDQQVSAAAAAALARIEPQGHQALYALTQHPEARIRTVTVEWFPLKRSGVAEVVARGLLDVDRQVNTVALGRISYASFTPLHLQLLRLLPEPTLPRIILLSKDHDPTIRERAFRALGAWWEARKQDLDAIVEHLMEGISDSDLYAGTVAAQELADLMSETTVPDSVVRLPRILAQLRDPARRSGHAALLTILTHLPLPDSSYGEVAEALIAAQTTNAEHAPELLVHYDLGSETSALLAAHPALAEAAVQAFTARYPNPKLVDEKAFETLEQVAGAGPKALQLLTQLLDNPNVAVRTRAAMLLSNYNCRESRVLDVLKDAVQPFKGYDWGDAADALARVGDEGVDRLTAIVEDPTVQANSRRRNLISHSLSKTPLPGPAHWLKEGSPVFNLIDFLGDLFFEKPGYFRVIVFAVTDDSQINQDPAARLPEPGTLRSRSEGDAPNHLKLLRPKAVW